MNLEDLMESLLTYPTYLLHHIVNGKATWQVHFMFVKFILYIRIQLIHCSFSIRNTLINLLILGNIVIAITRVGKTRNLDVHFSSDGITGNLPKNIDNMFSHREKFEGLESKRCTRIVVGNSYNLLTLKQILSWGDNPIMEWRFCNKLCCIWDRGLKCILIVVYLYGQWW